MPPAILADVTAGANTCWVRVFTHKTGCPAAHVTMGSRLLSFRIWDGESISAATRRGLAGLGVLQLWHSSRLCQTHNSEAGAEWDAGRREGGPPVKGSALGKGVACTHRACSRYWQPCGVSTVRQLPDRRPDSIVTCSAFAEGAARI